MTRHAWTLVLLLSLVATQSFASDSDGPPGPARLDGEWTLDWDRSDSFETAMTALETPWLLRRLAGIARVSLEWRAATVPTECDECVDKVMMTLHTPISSQEVEIIFDGQPRPGEDPRGRATSDRYSWTADGGMEMIRELELPSGRQARILETRKLGADPDTMLSKMTVWVDGTERASMNRTFIRTSD